MEGGKLIVPVQMDNSAFYFLILSSLFIYRLSYLIAKEEGPFGIFSRLRGWIDPNQSTWIGRGVRCPVCASFWISFSLAFALAGRDFYTTIFLWFSLAGLAMLFERVSV